MARGPARKLEGKSMGVPRVGAFAALASAASAVAVGTEDRVLAPRPRCLGRVVGVTESGFGVGAVAATAGGTRAAAGAVPDRGAAEAAGADADAPVATPGEELSFIQVRTSSNPAERRRS